MSADTRCMLAALRRQHTQPRPPARSRQADALMAAIDALAAGDDSGESLRAIARAACSAVDADRVSVWTVDTAARLLRRQATAEIAHVTAAEAEMLRTDDDVVASLLSTGELQIGHAASNGLSRGIAQVFHSRSVLAIPFLQAGRITGVVTAHSIHEHREWSADDVTVLAALAVQCGLALHRTHLALESTRMALEDALTGLPNRTLLMDRTAQAIATGNGNGTTAVLCVVNLDRFREINDGLGHAAGDAILREVGQRLKSEARAYETVARLGRDEFAVLLPASSELPADIAQRFLRALADSMTVAGRQVGIAATLGMAHVSRNAATAELLLRSAECALADARHAGTRFASVSAAHQVSDGERFEMIAALRKVLDGDADGGALQLYYQPKVDCRTREVRGLEALIRWRHPNLGMISPGHFIPLAEQVGLIGALTRWALEAAVAQAQTWLSRGIRLGIAVNLSAQDVQNTDLPELIATLLERYRVSPELLMVEITESMLVQNGNCALDVLRRLAEVDVHAALDDFGTGYSSLAYLKHLPVRDLKIDQSFVKDISRDKRDQAIVAATVSLGHSLGMRVVAEGVEDEETLRCLRALGTDVVQGYLISRPLPAEELELWLAST